MIVETSKVDRRPVGAGDLFGQWVRRDLMNQFAIAEGVPDELLALIEDADLPD